MTEESAPPPATVFGEAFPTGLRDRERALLAARWNSAQLSPWNADRLVGVGLSGGGIRSATFALGLFQGLARKSGLLREIDYLSTVSGGGYFGSFFGRLLTRDYVETPDDVEAILTGKKRPEVLNFLRENGRYLSPNGAGDSLLFGAAILRNLVSIHVVLACFVLAVFLGLQSLRGVLDLMGIVVELPAAQDALIWWSPLLWLPLVSFGFIACPAGWAYWLAEPERKVFQRAVPGKKVSAVVQETSEIPPVAGLLLVFVVSVFLAIITQGKMFAALWASFALVALVTFAVWRLALWRLPDLRPMEQSGREQKMDQALYRDRGLRNRLGLWLTGALVLTAALLTLGIVDSLGQSVYAVLKGEGTIGTWLAAIFSSLGVLAGFSRWITIFFSKGSKGARPSLPMQLIANLAALLIVLLLLVTLDAASHAIAYGLRAPQGAPARLMEAKRDERSYGLKVGSGEARGITVRICKDCKPPAVFGPAAARDPMLAFLGFGATLLMSILFGQTWPFVNRSSHLPLYAARLTRAYLGASNPKRREGHSITQPVEGDDSDLARYWPPPAASGAPIHLINVTINETIDGQSQVQQQDRKGLGLALGPWGMSAGVKHHLVMPLGDDNKMNPEGEAILEIYPPSGYRVFDYPAVDGRNVFAGEPLPLGTWLSISGAAFSTGTGFRTSLGLSLLAGLGNVRLGRWWDSGVVRRTPAPRIGADGREVKPPKRKFSLRLEDLLARLFPVQVYLLDEFLARFPGTARRHWYLSDGGHFENMGGYELLRRRLHFIMIVDGEMDADSTFEGLANLVRKARLDFGAEVRFLTEEQLDEVVDDAVRPYVGALEQLRRGTWEISEPKRKGPHGRLVEAVRTGRSLAHAALARVTYEGDTAVSWLLYVKPALTGREPVDVLEYHQSHPNFPHEPTIDQFFDEAQWESYRRLGQYTADVLFGSLDRLVPVDDRHPKTLLADWSWDPASVKEREKQEGRLPSYS